MLVDRDDVQVIALKPAFQGDAVVVRLASFAPAAVEVRLSCPSRPIRKATLCDARERELCDLEVRNDGVMVPMPHALASVLVWL
jgi:alpha-mannosidase